MAFALAGSNGYAQSSGEGSRPTTWSFNIRYQATGSDNADAALLGSTVADAPRSVIMDTFSSRLGVDRQTPRSQVAAFARANFSLYRNLGEYNDLGYGGGVSGYYNLSPRLVWTFGQDVSLGGFEPDLFASQGIQLVSPELQASASLSRTGLSFQMSERTTLSVDTGYDWLSVESPALIDGASFLLGQDPTTLRVSSPIGASSPLGGTRLVVQDSQRFALGALATQGLRTTSFSEHSVFGSVQIAHGLTPRTDLFGRFQFGTRKFSSLESEFDDQLVDGTDVEFQTAVRHALTANSGASLSYDIRRIDSQIVPITSHDVLLGWDQSIAREGLDISMRIAGGVNVFEPSGTEVVVDDLPIETQLTPIVESDLTASIRDRTTIAVRYARQANETVGFGNNLSIHNVGASVTRTIGSRLILALDGEWIESSNLLAAEAQSVGASRLSASAQFNVATQIGVGGGYAFNRFSDFSEGADVQEEAVWHFYVVYFIGQLEDALGAR